MGSDDRAVPRHPATAPSPGTGAASRMVTEGPTHPSATPARTPGGDVVLVTGAAGGIGQAVARHLAAGGARVVLTGRGEEALRGVDLGPGRVPAAVHLLDVRDAAAWDRVVAAVLDGLGSIDLLVSNAGVVDPGPLEEATPERLARVVETNLLGAMLGARAVLPAMKRQGRGAIVFVGSLGGLVPMPFETSYAASKAAVRHFALSLRAEVAGSGVTVSVVTPDSVDTPQLAQELRFDEASLSFASPPLPPDAVARAVARAARGGAPEILVPAAGGLGARMAAAFPRLLLWLLPWLRRSGASRMERMRSGRR